MAATGDSDAGSKIELAAEVLTSLGELRIRVTGSSMLPAIWPGDVLLVRRCNVLAAGVGDVVLFKRHSRLFAHRVVSCADAGLLTRGDAIGAADAPIAGPELLGKVHGVVRGGRSLPGSTKETLAQRITAALVRRSPLAGRLLLRLYGLRRRARP